MMLSDTLANQLSEVAYILGIGVAIMLILLGVICLVMGVIILTQDDPEYLGYVPLPRRVDSDDEDS